MNWKMKLLKIILGFLVVIIPAVLTYCQARMEIKSKYEDAHEEAGHGYRALAHAVKEMQISISEQHDQIIQLQAYITAMETLYHPDSPKPDARGMMMKAIRPHATAAPQFTPINSDYDSLVKSEK